MFFLGEKGAKAFLDERKNRGSNFSVTVHYILLVSCVELQFSIGNNASVPDFGENFFFLVYR
jgi:hypothetical protein